MKIWKYNLNVYTYESMPENGVTTWSVLNNLVKYERVGDVMLLCIFGKETFYKVGEAWSLFGLCFLNWKLQVRGPQ